MILSPWIVLVLASQSVLFSYANLKSLTHKLNKPDHVVTYVLFVCKVSQILFFKFRQYHSDYMSYGDFLRYEMYEGFLSDMEANTADMFLVLLALFA